MAERDGIGDPPPPPPPPGYWRASDGNWYPPQQQASTYVVAPPPRRGTNRAAMGCGLAVAAVLSLAVALTVFGVAVGDEAADTTTTAAPVGGIDTNSDNRSNPPPADVTLDDCTVERGLMVAVLSVRNNSSKRSDYNIDVTFESPDGDEKYGSGMGFVFDLEPGQRATEQVNSLTESPGEFSCRVVEVDRTAS